MRVTDFGLARHVDDSATEAGVAGTPSYLASEQARGEPADRRTDVYGLGTGLYEMLSGRPPHVGNSPAETMRLVPTKYLLTWQRFVFEGVLQDFDRVMESQIAADDK